MKECMYILSGVIDEPMSIDDLYDYLDKNPSVLTGTAELLFSLDSDLTQFKQYEKLKQVGTKSIKLKPLGIKVNDEMFRFEEDSGLIGENNEISISDFLDNSPNAIKSNGERIYRPLDRENYKNSKIENYIQEKGLTQEIAEELVEDEISNWDIIKENSQYLHRLATLKEIGGSPETNNNRKLAFVAEAKKFLPDSSSLKNDKMLMYLFDIFTNFYMKQVGYIQDNKVLRNLNITSKANTGETLYAHIDYAIIGPNGKIKIYIFKPSSQYHGQWSGEKIKKYRLELAFIKQMLVNNGINVKDIEMNLVPITVEYNEDYTEINKIVPNLVPVQYEYNKRKEYINGPQDFIARKFIEYKTSDIQIGSLSHEQHLLNIIFPTLYIEKEGIKKSALELIKQAPSYGDEPLLIKEINDGEHRYVVEIEGKLTYIKDYAEKKYNKEILDLVTNYLINLNNQTGTLYSNRVADAIQHTFQRKLTKWDFQSLSNSVDLESLLSPYIDYTTENIDGETEIRYKWEFNDSLVDCGILIFINKDTGQLDTVTLSTKNLQQRPDYNYGTNILGGYKTNRDFLWDGKYGNVETVRTLVLLNKIIDQFPEGTQLGTQHIANYQGQHMQYDFDTSTKYFTQILKAIKPYIKDEKFKLENKLHSYKKVDLFESVAQQFISIVSNNKVLGQSLRNLTKIQEKGKDVFLFDEGWESDKNFKEDYQKVRALLSILNYFQQNHADIVRNILDVKKMGGYNGDLARLYEIVSKAYLYYSGEQISYEDKLKSYEKYMYTAPTVPDANINIAVTNLQTTIDSVANDCDEEYSTNLRQFIMDYYKACGYTNIENITLGTQNRLFNHLFQTDEKGQRIMVFRNPYTDSDLKPHERIFLKKALFFFNKYNFKEKQKFKSWDDPKIADYIVKHIEYLNVPLKRASKSTRRQRGLGDRLERFKKVFNILRKGKGKDWYNEFVEGITEEERELYDQAFLDMQYKDPYDLTERQRNRFISNNGVDYFETNIEKLLIDRMFSSIQTQKMNRMLLGTQALLTQLKILGNNSGFEEVFQKEENYIKEYIGLNVFKHPIVEEGFSGKLYSFGQGMRSGITLSVIAGNTISAARDIENGFMENYLRTATKFLTDISAKNLTKAYAYVVKNATTDAMKINLLSKLCVRYRLSNTDTARITERLETNRQGLANWDNIAFSTLRSPDFLNRMTLFIARAMQDGVLDAWSIENGTLKYDWKKDKRFSVYADKSKKGTKEYKEQQALYMLQIKEWNKDHPDNQLDYTDDLPTPYSDQEILSIKNLSNNIYGSYDRSLKSMGEFTAIGAFFGMYTTWMNGIWNNWMMKPGQYNIQRMKTEQDTDINGNLLWLDEYGQITTENTGVPCLKHIPVIVQGIAYTLGDAFNILNRDGYKAAIDYIKSDERAMRGLAQAGAQTILAIIFSLLFKFIIDPKYAETKKGYKDMNTLGILMSELTFKPLRPATDSFYGPLNIFNYFSENTDPPLFNVPVKMINDGVKTVFGDKTLGQFITGNFAVARIGKEVAKIQAKQQA